MAYVRRDAPRTAATADPKTPRPRTIHDIHHKPTHRSDASLFGLDNEALL